MEQINKYYCQFCNSNEPTTSIIDKETLQEIFICQECENLIYPNIEINLQELDIERKIDELIDCQIDELKLQREGIEI